MGTALIYDDRFLDHRTGPHPETPRRLEVIHSALEGDQDLWSRLQHARPVAASDEDITRCHSPRLIDQIRAAAEDPGSRQLDPDTVISAKSLDVARLAVGAAIRAVKLVVEGDVENAFAAVRPPGHHARPEAVMGFCLFNNAAIAARYAQAVLGLDRVLIVDWDVHHGNGVQEIFYSDSTVFYFSTHQYPGYPGTGAPGETGRGRGNGYTLNVALRPGTAASTHREAFTGALDYIGEHFAPDLVIVSAGFDSRLGDPLGRLMLLDQDFAEMTKEILGLAAEHASGRVVSLLEGGYNLDYLGGSVHEHVAALVAG